MGRDLVLHACSRRIARKINDGANKTCRRNEAMVCLGLTMGNGGDGGDGGGR